MIAVRSMSSRVGLLSLNPLKHILHMTLAKSLIFKKILTSISMLVVINIKLDSNSA
jgi:hypothetical protein